MRWPGLHGKKRYCMLWVTTEIKSSSSYSLPYNPGPCKDEAKPLSTRQRQRLQRQRQRKLRELQQERRAQVTNAGLHMRMANEDSEEVLGLVHSVSAGGNAERAGVLPGDRVVAYKLAGPGVHAIADQFLGGMFDSRTGAALGPVEEYDCWDPVLDGDAANKSGKRERERLQKLKLKEKTKAKEEESKESPNERDRRELERDWERREMENRAALRENQVRRETAERQAMRRRLEDVFAVFGSGSGSGAGPGSAQARAIACTDCSPVDGCMWPHIAKGGVTVK